MSDELRIKVCEWLGWDVLETTVGTTGRPMGRKSGTDWMLLPELTLDLMHEAEARLTDEEHVEFQSHLWDVTEPEGVKEADVRDVSNLLDQWERARTSPTAEQRATALLRAVEEKGAA